jgi:hypothetical protein
MTQDGLFPSTEHDPGGKVTLSLPAGMTGSAIFGGTQNELRYWLARCWDESKPTMGLCMMNPSTASADYNDPTVAKGCRLAQKWGFGRLIVVNVFAYRATSPKDLLKAHDPIGPENDFYILRMATLSKIIVMAYGKPHKKLQERGSSVADMLETFGHGDRLHVLKLCQDGTPSHPLYLSESLLPQVWRR